jgi:hypothetical protein
MLVRTTHTHTHTLSTRQIQLTSIFVVSLSILSLNIAATIALMPLPVDVNLENGSVPRSHWHALKIVHQVRMVNNAWREILTLRKVKSFVVRTDFRNGYANVPMASISAHWPMTPRWFVIASTQCRHRSSRLINPSHSLPFITRAVLWEIPYLSMVNLIVVVPFYPYMSVPVRHQETTPVPW